MNDDKNVRQFEGEVYFPSPEVIERTRCKDYDSMYKRSIEDPEKFWEDIASEFTWSKKWDKVFDDSNPPFF